MIETPFDYSGDGVTDAMEVVGGPGDGFVHATAIDADQNGVFETMHVDIDGDNLAEVTFFDADQNGVIDSGQIDQNGNQVADAFVADTNGDGVFDVRVDDANENGVNDLDEARAAVPSAVPSPSQLEALIVLNQGKLIGLYEQILNTPVDPNDPLAVENKAAALQRVAEAVAVEQGKTARIIEGM